MSGNKDVYTWANYKIRLVMPIKSLEDSYNMQVWCEQTLGNRWATTPPGEYKQEWYFIDEADATLFRLKWL